MKTVVKLKAKDSEGQYLMVKVAYFDVVVEALESLFKAYGPEGEGSERDKNAALDIAGYTLRDVRIAQHRIESMRPRE